jgi:hypothetical protein
MKFRIKYNIYLQLNKNQFILDQIIIIFFLIHFKVERELTPNIKIMKFNKIKISSLRHNII